MGTWFLDWMGDIGRVEVGGRGSSRVSRGWVGGLVLKMNIVEI